MKLLLAMSADGYLATGPNDSMKWTGTVDKAIFRLLTLSEDDNILLAGSKTHFILPELRGRSIIRLSRDTTEFGFTLDSASRLYPNAWIIGGPTVAAEALRLGLLHRVFICFLPNVTLGSGIGCHKFVRFLSQDPEFTIKFPEVDVRIYTKEQLGYAEP